MRRLILAILVSLGTMTLGCSGDKKEKSDTSQRNSSEQKVTPPMY